MEPDGGTITREMGASGSPDLGIRYVVDDATLTADQFLTLVQRVWPGEYDPVLTQGALRKTLNITAWHGDTLVGCVRVLTDGYFFGTVPEILVDPAHRGRGIGRELMERAWDVSPAGLFFGAQPGNEPFFEKLGYRRSLVSYARSKPRPRR